MDSQRLQAAIASAQRGLGEGFQELLEAYGPRLYGYFMRATGNHHDAEDLLGEMYLRLVRRLRDYHHRGRFEPWLFRIAANMVRDRIRRRRVRPAMADGPEDQDGSPLERLAAVNGTSADSALVAQETQQQVTRALARLDDKSRQAILLRHFGQLSFREIARMQGCPLGTALARVHRGLRRLRELMGDDDG